MSDTDPLDEEDRLGEIFEDAYLRGIIDSSGLSWFKHGKGQQELTKLIQTLEKKARMEVVFLIPKKIDLSTFEPDEDGGISVNVDENNDNITGENLIHLAKYAESKGFNQAIDEIHANLNIKENPDE